MKRLLLVLLHISLFVFSCEEEQDTTPPTVTITSPQDNSSVFEIVSITCISSDNEGVEKVELWVNGVTTGLFDETEPYSFDWNTILVDNGNYTITIRSYDISGNTTDSEPIVLIVDNPTEVTLWGVVYSIENTDSLYLYEIQGSILPEIGNLINLTYLFLSDGLTGVIPPEIGNLINLTYLKLEGDLTGVIPPEIGNLTNLIHLDLGYQYLEGSIPPEIYNLTNLTHLYLNDNALTGSIPLEIGNLTSLTHLYLNNNELTGHIPLEIGNLTNLTHLGLEINALAGSIPTEIGNLTSLTELMLYANQLTGSIPPEIGNLTNLTHLWIDENQLTGSIPSEIGNLTNLVILGLSSNQLTGEIPESICDLNISWDGWEFNISNNQLCPPYPSCIEDYVGEQDTSNCD